MGWLSGIADFANDIFQTSLTASEVGGGLATLGGGLLGGGLTYLGAQDSADATLAAAQTQADALRANAQAAAVAAQPYSVASLAGTASFDDDTKTALLNLSPQLAQIYQGSLDRAGLFGGQASILGADPFGAANVFYAQQQQYFQPREDKARTDLETRLLQQGRLGSSGGAYQTGELERGILEAQQQRQTQSFGQAQSLIESLLGRESADIGQAVGLMNIPLQQAQLGRGIGGDLGQAAQYGLASRSEAAKGLAQANAFSPTGNALSGLGGLFMDNLRPQTGN